MSTSIDLESHTTKVRDRDTSSRPSLLTPKLYKSTSSHVKRPPEDRNSSKRGKPVGIDSIPLSIQPGESSLIKDEDLSSITHPPGKPRWLLTAGVIIDAFLLLSSLLFIGFGILAKYLDGKLVASHEFGIMVIQSTKIV
jgi:hypothetical protein